MVSQLDLSHNQLCGIDADGKGQYNAEGITAIADAMRMRVNGGLTVANLLGNQLDAESAKMLAEVAKQKGISLCGIQRDQTTADFSLYEPPDAILLASDLSQAVVTGVLTSLDLEGTLCGLDSHGRGTYTAEGITAIAEALIVNGVLTGINVRDGDIAGDGATQLSAAVLGNIKIEMFNKIPIKEMRADSFTELDLKGKGFGVVGGMVVAGLIPVMGGLTSIDLSGNNWLCGIWTDGFGDQQGTYTAEGIIAIADALRVNGGLTVTSLLGNQLDAESAKMLAEVAKLKDISLCGIQRDQTTADFSSYGLLPPDAILLASELSQASVTGALTALNLSSNCLGDEGVSAVCKAIQSNKETKLASLNFENNGIGPVGANAVAAMVAVTGGLHGLHRVSRHPLLWSLAFVGLGAALAVPSVPQAVWLCGPALMALLGGAHIDFRHRRQLGATLTSIDLSGNQLCGIWTDDDGDQHGTYTAEGITAIADALRVNGALTVTNLLGNQLDAESAKMLAEVAKQKGISLCGIQRDQTTADFRNQDLQPPDAILLGSDLSQAVVTGGLTSIDLSGNQLCGIYFKWGEYIRGTYTAEGIAAIAEALRVNGGLTSLNLSSNLIGGYWDHEQRTNVFTPEGPKAIADALLVNGALTSLDISNNRMGDDGVKPICEALKQNSSLKALDLNASQTSGGVIGPQGAQYLADMLSVNGALTALNLSSNYLGDEGVSAVCEAIQSNKETKLASLHMGKNRFGPVGAKSVAAMVAVTGVLTSINLSNNVLCGVEHWGQGIYTVEGITAIADALRVNGALTSLAISNNRMGDDGVKPICEALKQNSSLKALDLNASQTSGGEIGPQGAQYLADLLSVNGALTSVDLGGNKLGDEGWGAIFAAICGNKDSKIMSMDASSESIGPAGGKLIAEALRTSVTGALTSVELRGNELGDEGWGAIFAAICGNKDSKIMAMDASSENIGSAGGKLIAEALRTSVTGALTVTNLLCNRLDAESAKMLAEVAKQKGVSLCGIQRDQTTADFSHSLLEPPDAILLASDLSQAVVTGALTCVDVRSNNIEDDGAEQLSAAVLGNLEIEMFNGIPIKEMRANSFTELDLMGNGVRGVRTRR